MDDRKIILTAFLVSLLVHLGLAAATWRLPFLKIEPPPARATADEVELILIHDSETPDSAGEMPQAYTSIPDRLATETPPEDPEFLAMHHSLAADNVIGGDENTPSAEEEWVASQVEIQQEKLDGAGGVSYARQPMDRPESGSRPVDPGASGQGEREVRSQELDGGGEWDLPRADQAAGQDDQDQQRKPADELAEWWGGQAPSILKEGKQSAVGDRGFDFNQVSKGTVGSGVAIDGDFSLNTYEWDYAPWMKRFSNELYRVWIAPYAYRLGVIHGKTLIRVVVEKDGRPSSMEVLETEGHESLHEASQAALTAFAPYAPLPDHFPEENLVIVLGLHYPAFRR